MLRGDESGERARRAPAAYSPQVQRQARRMDRCQMWRIVWCVSDQMSELCWEDMTFVLWRHKLIKHVTWFPHETWISPHNLVTAASEVGGAGRENCKQHGESRIASVLKYLLLFFQYNIRINRQTIFVLIKWKTEFGRMRTSHIMIYSEPSVNYQKRCDELSKSM